jgi:hypothetical protein
MPGYGYAAVKTYPIPGHGVARGGSLPLVRSSTTAMRRARPVCSAGKQELRVFRKAHVFGSRGLISKCFSSKGVGVKNWGCWLVGKETRNPMNL